MDNRMIPLILCAFGVLSLSCGGSVRGERGARWRGGGAYIGISPAVSPDGTLIAFGSPRDGLGDIYLMDIDGTNIRRLTDTPEYEGEPAFSSDGSQIVFTSERDGSGNIYIMEIDGTHQRPLTRTPSYESNPRFSPDGSKIVFVRQGEIYIMSSDGSGPIPLTIPKVNGISKGSSSFSPDEKRILFQSVSFDTVRRTAFNEIWVMNADGTEAIRLHAGGYVPAYSPDGNTIIFIGETEDYYTQEIYMMDADGSNVRQLTHSSGFKGEMVFTPDGSKIIFVKVGPGGRSGSIYVVHADGSNPRRLLKIY